MIQLYIYMYPLFFRFFSHIGYYRILGRAPMSIAALFTIAKTWKQPTCPSTGEWIKKTWYVHTTDLLLIHKKE